MKPKLVELRPDRNLLNPNFKGYKISLVELPVCEKELPVPVDTATPDSSQYSFLHARLFGLQNHIFAEEFHGMSYVYFVDKNWCIWKLYTESFSHQFTEPFLVWKVPKDSERLQGQYNITLKFLTSELAVLSAPRGFVYILNTGERSVDSEWNVAFKENLLTTDKDFIIQDAFYNEKNELHLLLLRIDQETTGEHWINVLYWVIISYIDKEWRVTCSRELQARGELYYSYFEPRCEAIYVASEKSFKFTSDCSNVTEENEKQKSEKKRYIWNQTLEDITVRFKLPENFSKSDLKITAKEAEIVVKYENNILLSGPLYQNICADLTVWDIKNELLEILLSKQEEGLMWPELVVGDTSGEFVVDTCIVDDIHQKLSHLCGEDEVCISLHIMY